MAEENTVIIDKNDRAAANAEVARKQAAQGIESHQPGHESGYGNTVDALDKLRDVVVEKRKSEAAVEAGEKDTPDPVVAEVVEKEAVVADPIVEEAKKAELEAAAAETKKRADDELAASQKVTDELFKDAPKLPANASPKSSEAFSAVKRRAAQEVSRLQSELGNLEKEAKVLRERTKEAITPELQKELESLREFKLRLDIETDPKWKSFDAGISKAHEFIYAQLKKSPAVTDEVIAEIKKLGGPDMVKMDSIFEGIKDPMIQRLVEAKLADVELQKYNKDQAISENKANTKKYLEERSRQWEQSASNHNTQTKAELDGLVGRIPWLNPVTPDAKADAAAKAAAESHNKYAEQMKGELEQAMSDDSPGMRATLLVGMAQLFRLQSSYEVLTKERDAIKKELAESKSTMDRLKASSTSRLRESSALPGAAPAAKKDDLKIGVRAGDALDQIRAEKARVAALT